MHEPVRPETLADLLAIPESDRFHELLEGTLVDKDAASGKHGEAQLSLGILLRPFRRGGAGGWIFATEVEVQFDDANVLRPDAVGWRRERLAELPAEVPIGVIPDWICEILSTNRANDLVRKKRIYHRHRVSHYWVIDPDAEMLTVYRHAPDGYLEALVAVRGETVRAEWRCTNGPSGAAGEMRPRRLPAGDDNKELALAGCGRSRAHA